MKGENMRKNLCIVLILLICFTATFTYAENENEVQNNTTDIYTQRNELQNQLSETTGELENVQSSLSENLQQVEKLDEKISSAETQLEEQESKITGLKNSINEIETQLNEVTEKYEKQKDLFQQRLVAIYEGGETQYLDLLLRSKSLSDFLSSYYIITQLAEIDNDLISELESKKNTIDLSKQKLENEKEELATLIETQTRLTRTLQNTKKIRESFISKLSDEEKQLQTKIDEINAQYDEINRQILELAGQRNRY